MTRSAIVSRGIILTLAAVAVAVGCGSKDDADKEDSTTATIKFSEIAPIVKTQCADAGCHGKATPASVVYEDNEENFKKSKDAPLSTKARMDLKATDASYMPRGKTITAADKQKLLDFLAQ